jgi:hypothetical protein
MDIKQRLQQVFDSTDLSYIGAATVAELCRDALAEIERLEGTQQLADALEVQRTCTAIIQRIQSFAEDNIALATNAVRMLKDAQDIASSR